MARKNDDDPPGQAAWWVTKRYLPIEPALMLHWISAIMAFQVLQDFLMEKACRVNFAYSDSVCHSLKTKTNLENLLDEEANVQKLVSSVLKWRMIIENMFPVFLVLLIGAWSDKYGRRLPMAFVTFGFLVQNIGLILCCIFDQFAGAWTVGVISSLFASIVGNHACFGMAAISYLTDTTSKENQTSRTGIFHASFMFAMIVGIALGGFFSGSTYDYKTIFAFAFILELIAFLYIFIGLTNIPRDEGKGSSSTSMIADLFDFKNFRDSFGSVFKPRKGNKRLKLLSLIVSHCSIMAPMMGELGVWYLFCSYQFKWNGADFGFFMTYKTVLAFVGTFVSLGVFNGILKLRDSTVGFISCLSFLLCSFMYTFAKTNTVMYIAPVVSILSGALMIVPRSIISKNIETSEQGKINSFIACFESIVPLFVGPLYSSIYTMTFETLPGTVFLLSGSFMIPPIIVFIVLFFTEEAEKPDKKKD